MKLSLDKAKNGGYVLRDLATDEIEVVAPGDTLHKDLGQALEQLYEAWVKGGKKDPVPTAAVEVLPKGYDDEPRRRKNNDDETEDFDEEELDALGNAAVRGLKFLQGMSRHRKRKTSRTPKVEQADD